MTDKMTNVLMTIAVAMSSVFSGSVFGDTHYSYLTISDSAAGLGAGPYAKVEITQGVDANTINVVETMLTPYYLINTGGPHNALTWSIKGAETISIVDAPTGYSLQGSPSNSPFGAFEWGIDCSKSACPYGMPGAIPGPLTFKIVSSGALSPSLFVVNSAGYLFSSDVVNVLSGNTGNVASVVSAVPEPETYAMLLLGLGLIGVFYRHNQA